MRMMMQLLNRYNFLEMKTKKNRTHFNLKNNTRLEKIKIFV